MSKSDQVVDYSVADQGGTGIGLREVVQAFQRRWWLILAITAIASAVALFMALRSEPMFNATAVVRIDNTRRAMTGGLDHVVPENMSWLDVTASQAHVISSRAVIGEVVAQERLDSTSQGARLTRERAIDEVIKGLAVTPRPRTVLIDINYVNADSLRAQRVVNAIARAFQAYHTRAAREAARQRREFIERQWAEAEAALTVAQQRLVAFRNSGFDGSPDRLRAEQSVLPALDRQRQQLEAKRRIYAAAVERIREARDDQIDAELRTLLAAHDSSSSQLLPQLNSQLTQLRIDRDRALGLGRAPTHPEVQRLTASLNATRSSVAEAVQTELASFDLRIAALREQRDRSASTIRSLSGTETEENRIMQGVSVLSGRAEALRAELNRARMAEAVEVGDAQILDLATVAVPVMAARTTQKIILTIMMGIILGCIATLLLEVTNTSIRSRMEIKGFTAIPALGVIPAIGAGPARSSQIIRRRSQTTAPAATHSLAAAEFHTPAAEAYRTVRANLMNRRAPNPLRSLLVTSAGIDEGKSTTAANLAVSFSRQLSRVLLIDGDLRRPNLHHFFGVKCDVGLIDVLVGRSTERDVITPTSFPGLDLITRGNFDERGAELFSLRTHPLIASVGERYDIVIVDTPPVLATADAAGIAAHVDGVLLVVRAGRTPRYAAREALSRLESVGANVVGFVLNDPESIAGRYGEYTYTREYYSVQS